jgi:hypothetical protein
MIALHDLMTFLDDFMGDVGDKDPYMANGLQVRGKEEIKLVATGVSASRPLPRDPWCETGSSGMIENELRGYLI